MFCITIRPRRLTATSTLRDVCLVQGFGEESVRYWPREVMHRASLIVVF